MVALAAFSSSSSWLRLSQAVSFAVWFRHASFHWQRPSRRWFDSLATPVANRFLPCLVAARKYRLADDCLFPVLISARGERSRVPPGLSLGRTRSRGPLS